MLQMSSGFEEIGLNAINLGYSVPRASMQIDVS